MAEKGNILGDTKKMKTFKDFLQKHIKEIERFDLESEWNDSIVLTFISKVSEDSFDNEDLIKRFHDFCQKEADKIAETKLRK
jgi:hypothetical protein